GGGGGQVASRRRSENVSGGLGSRTARPGSSRARGCESPLRRRMIGDMTIRKFAPEHDYVRRIKNFAAFVGRSPDTAEFRSAASRRDLAVQEVADQRDDFVGPVFEREVPGVDQVKLDLGQVTFIGVRPVGRENLVVLAPDDKGWRLIVAEVRLHQRI